VSPLPVWVPKPSYIALDLEAKTRQKANQKHGRQMPTAQYRGAEQEGLPELTCHWRRRSGPRADAGRQEAAAAAEG
jgi:hypothetical protein